MFTFLGIVASVKRLLFRQKICILEVKEGDEKLRDAQGYRKDSMPIVESLKSLDLDANIDFYSNDTVDLLYSKLRNYSAVISRVNPGNIVGGEIEYFNFLRRLEKAGVKLFSSPDTMLTYGAKDAVAKLAGSPIVPKDVFCYYTLAELKKNFPNTLKTGTRVLKQNRGSQGSGIWKVEVKAGFKGDINDKTPIVCTEAEDNHTVEFKLSEFMNFCEKYVEGENGMLVDMPFLPRIAEGEIRILLVGEKPIFVVHKKPVEGGFSATLGSGAKYTYQSPTEWPSLIEVFIGAIPMIKQLLGGPEAEAPIIWTSDFILGPKTDKGNDTYVLGEINCSCVGFTNQLDCGIQKQIADEIFRRLNRND